MLPEELTQSIKEMSQAIFRIQEMLEKINARIDIIENKVIEL